MQSIPRDHRKKLLFFHELNFTRHSDEFERIREKSTEKHDLNKLCDLEKTKCIYGNCIKMVMYLAGTAGPLGVLCTGAQSPT
jgi:hypothetical protein